MSTHGTQREDKDAQILFADVRSLRDKGTSVTLAVPLRVLKEEFNVDPDELRDGSVRVEMDSKGVLKADFERFAD